MKNSPVICAWRRQSSGIPKELSHKGEPRKSPAFTDALSTRARQAKVDAFQITEAELKQAVERGLEARRDRMDDEERLRVADELTADAQELGMGY